MNKNKTGTRSASAGINSTGSDQTEFFEALSAWVDEELTIHDRTKLLDQCLGSSEARRRFESYQVIKAAFNNDTSQHWQMGFSERVASQIDSEPTVLAPQSRAWRKPLMGWSVAASVALSFVIGAQYWPTGEASNTSEPLTNVASITNNNAPNGMVAEYHVTEEEKAQLERINSIFSQYSSKQPAKSDSSPYVRLVSGEQVSTFYMTPRQFRQVMMELERRNREAELKAQQN